MAIVFSLLIVRYYLLLIRVHLTVSASPRLSSRVRIMDGLVDAGHPHASLQEVQQCMEHLSPSWQPTALRYLQSYDNMFPHLSRQLHILFTIERKRGLGSHRNPLKCQARHTGRHWAPPGGNAFPPTPGRNYGRSRITMATGNGHGNAI